jgi:tryptophan synthase alpha chain
MSVQRLRGAFGRRPALVTYVMAGDGGVDATIEAVQQCVAGGANVIELGFPFSDPIADGPVIQRAAARALAGGTTLRSTLDLAESLRRRVDVPLVLMGYLNPVLSFGLERFVARAVDAGIDGLIIPDLPPEEAGPLCELATRADLATTFMLAPTSTASREKAVIAATTGFIYFVSVTGVTGARTEAPDIRPHVERIRKATTTPVAIGFGISTPEHARAYATFADGVIVGSALVDRFARAEPLTPFVTSLRTALEGLTC